MTVQFTDLSIGSHRIACPSCANGKRGDKTLGVTIDHTGAGVAHCFRCGFVQTYRPETNAQHQRTTIKSTQRQPVQRVQEPAPAHETLSQQGRELWWSTKAVQGDSPAGHYLNERRCVLPPRGSHLRWLPAHRHPSGHTGPCLVALLTDAQTRQARSLHFTWIDGGRKADVNPPRLLLARHRKAGAVCRLWPDETVTQGLGVAEGIESALSLAHAYTPVWATIDAGNLAALPCLPGIEWLVIARDRDAAGEAAAAQCASRWSSAGATVSVTAQQVNDLNDLVQGVCHDA